MENYIFIVIADILFSLQFLMTGTYSKRTKGTVSDSLSFSCGTALIIGTYMIFVDGFTNGFGVDITWYSVLLSVGMVAVMLLSSYFSIKSLKYINLSLYSVFLMLGGMIVPSVFGITVGEPLTLGKLLCAVLIIGAMALSVEKTGGGKKGAAKYYFACFFLNGCGGVFAKLLTMYKEYEVSSNDFLITYTLLTAVLSFILLTVVTRGRPLERFKDIKCLGCMGGYSVFHGVAQMLSLLTISNGMDVSVQQPLVSGGVLVMSFIISVTMRERQTWKNVLSFVISVLAVLAISFINIKVF